MIGNGFDLAHGLPTRYEDFILWYWDAVVDGFYDNYTNIAADKLYSFKIKDQIKSWNIFAYKHIAALTKICGKEVIDKIIASTDSFEVNYTPFFNNICKSIETKGWVDVEAEYYNLLGSFLWESKYDNPKILNDELYFLRDKLIEYLNIIQERQVKSNIINLQISKIIFSPFSADEISIRGMKYLDEHIASRCMLDEKHFLAIIKPYYDRSDIECAWLWYRDNYQIDNMLDSSTVQNVGCESEYFLRPGRIMLLNFNYTSMADMYLQGSSDVFTVNHIHGHLNEPENVIFGYGDERDEKYKQIMNLQDNEYLRNIKSVKYLETDNYRKLLSFADSAPFQIYIMGHSCGNSDGTLLNTLFEHNNCVSIKPYYYVKDGKDNYNDLIANISRNFNDMRIMRDLVVNKTFCEPLPQNCM